MREPEKYGHQRFEDFFQRLKTRFPSVELRYFQSNTEGELINKIHEVGFTFDGVVLNAGAYTHTSIAIADAIAAVKTPVIEVHISNVHAREKFRHNSYISPVAKGIIVGCGLEGYALAIHYLISVHKI